MNTRPVESRARELSATVPWSTLPKAGGGPEHVLVVEDSATQAAALAALLEGDGYRTTIARDGSAALTAVSTTHFDLVLSDIVMPGLTGYEVCRCIKRDLGRHDLPVVLLTGLSDPMDIVRGLECGADNYITKPYERTHLLDRVRQVLDNRRLRGNGDNGDGVDITFLGSRFTITAEKEQILDLLVSSYEELVRTNQAARQAEMRARFLAEASGILAMSLDADTIVRDLARFMVPAMADVCVANLVDDDGRIRQVEVAHVAPQFSDAAALLYTRGQAPGTPSLVTQVLRQQLPILLADMTSADLPPLDVDRSVVEATVAVGLNSVMAVPLTARGHTLGALLFSRGPSRKQFSSDDFALAIELTRQTALAVDNARLYRAAQQATRARDDVLAIVSHDLRNPIHAVYMAATFMLDILPEESDNADVAVSRRQSEVIQRAARRANALIGDLLDVTRIEAGRFTVSTQAVGAGELLSDAVHDAMSLASSKRLRLESTADDSLPAVCADRERIAQLFSNLLGNAIKFTPDEGTVRVDAEVGDGVVRFTVADSGPGIAPDNLPHLFDRYWQARETQHLGTGLGLFIARGIAEAHGGSLWVESVPGCGAAFHFTLPVA